jgi:hypothetical protein
MTSDALLSSQPSIQAMEATMKIMKPATVMRAFTLAATRVRPEQLPLPRTFLGS